MTRRSVVAIVAVVLVTQAVGWTEHFALKHDPDGYGRLALAALVFAPLVGGFAAPLAVRASWRRHRARFIEVALLGVAAGALLALATVFVVGVNVTCSNPYGDECGFGLVVELLGDGLLAVSCGVIGATMLVVRRHARGD